MWARQERGHDRGHPEGTQEMDNERQNFLEQFAERVEMGIERNWANSIEQKQIVASEEAQQIVANVLKHQLLSNTLKSTDLGMKVLHGLLALEEVFPALAPSENDIDLAIARAKDDYTTFQALRVLIVLGFPQNFVVLRAWERALKADLLTEPPVPKGPSVFRDAQRNMLIISQIKQLEQLNFKPTRSEKKNKALVSGCDIVSRAMGDIGRGMPYSTIETIWKNRDKIPRPKTLAVLLSQATVGDLED